MWFYAFWYKLFWYVYMYIKYQVLCNTKDKKILHADLNKLKSEL